MAKPPLILISPSIEKRGVEFHDLSLSLSFKYEKSILDAGGNVAISPSGRRVALLNAGAIQVFDLPPATPLPAGASGP